MNMPDDSELLRRYAEEGSQEAFATLVERYVGMLYGTACRQLGGSQRADDVVQTVFIDLASKAKSLGQRPVLAGWLYTATHYAASKIQREEQRRQQRESEAQRMHESPENETSDASWEKLKPVLDEALATLNGNDREAILLRFFQAMPFSAVGENLQVSEEAARKRVDRAVEKLRHGLGKKGFVSTSAALALVLSQQTATAAPLGLAAKITTAAATGLLGTAGASTPAALKFFAFMSTSKSIVAVSAIALLATGSALYEAKQLQSINADRAGLNQDRAALRSELKTSNNQLTEFEREKKIAQTQIASLQHELEILKKASAAPGTANRAQKSKGGNPAANAHALSTDDLVTTDPEFQELNLKQEAAGLGLKFGALYRKLHLTPQQIAEFERIELERQRAIFDASSAAKTQGLSVNDANLSAIEKEITLNSSKQMFDLLGEGINQLGPYCQALDAQDKVNSLAGYLYGTDAPLTLEQGEQMKQILSANTETSKYVGLVGTEAKTNVDAVMAQVGKVLSPTQAEIFRAMTAKAQLEAQANKRAILLLQTAGGPESNKP